MIDELERRQKAANMTDQEFADVLRISRQLWQFHRSGRVPRLGRKALSGTAAAFPDLKEQVMPLFFLHPIAKKMAKPAENEAEVTA